MKVVHKKSIIEKLDEEIFKSCKLNKKIEKIILSQEEWHELYNKLKYICTYPIAETGQLEGGHKATYKGVPIYVEQEDT